MKGEYEKANRSGDGGYLEGEDGCKNIHVKDPPVEASRGGGDGGASLTPTHTGAGEPRLGAPRTLGRMEGWCSLPLSLEHYKLQTGCCTAPRPAPPSLPGRGPAESTPVCRRCSPRLHGALPGSKTHDLATLQSGSKSVLASSEVVAAPIPHTCCCCLASTSVTCCHTCHACCVSIPSISLVLVQSPHLLTVSPSSSSADKIDMPNIC